MNIEGLDELDNKILNIIKENARLSFSDIGKMCGVTRVSVKNRMEILEKKGIIQGYHTIINPTKVPSGEKFFLDIETYPEAYKNVAQKLSREYAVRQIYAVTGDSRIHAVGFAPDKNHLQSFVNRLYRDMEGIRRIGVHVIMSTLMDIDSNIAFDLEETKEKTDDYTEEKSAGFD